MHCAKFGWNWSSGSEEEEDDNVKSLILILNCNISLKEWFNLFDMYYTRFTLHRRAYQHQVVKAVEIM